MSYHHGWTLHRADGNGTTECREAHTIQFAAHGTSPHMDGSTRKPDRVLTSCGADMRWSAAAPRTPTAEGGERTPGAYLRDHGVPCLWHEDEAAQPRKTQHKL